MTLAPRAALHSSLFGLALALGVILAFDRGRPTTNELSARVDNLLPVVRRDDLTELRVVDRSGKNPELVVRRLLDVSGSARYALGDAGADGGDLDPAAVDALLSALEFAKWHEPPRTVGAGEPVDLGELDLELRLEMGAVTARVLLGGVVPSRPNLRYAEVTATGAPRRVGLVSASLIERIGRDRRAFESRLLLPVGRDHTRELTLRHGARTVTLRFDGRGFVFDAEGGSQRRVGPGALDRVFFQLARASIRAPLPDPKDVVIPALELRQRTRTASGAPGVEYALSLGGECPGHPDLVFAHRTAPSELSGCVPASILGTLASSIDTLEDRSLVPLGADEIDHLIVESMSGSANRQLDLVRDGTEFLLRSPVERPLALEPGNSFIAALLEARPPLEGLPPLEPTARLRVFGHPPGASETAEFVVELFGEPGKWSVARRLDDGVLLALDEMASWSLSKEATWFESREILSIEPAAVRSFATFTKDGDEQLVAADSGRDLEFRDGSTSDRSLTSAALALLHPLTALRWLPPREGRAVTPPVVVVEVGLDGGKKERIVVWSRVRGGYAAELDGGRGRFVLPVRTVSTWLRSLADRSPATLIPADYAKIELRAGAIEHVLTRRGEHLTTTTQVDDGFGEAVEEALLGFVPISARRGMGSGRSPSTLEIATTAANGQEVTFHVRGPTTFEGVSVYELGVDSAPRSYFVEAGVVQALLDLL